MFGIMNQKARDYFREAVSWAGDVAAIGIIFTGLYMSGLVKHGDPLKEIHVIEKGEKQLITHKSPEDFQEEAVEIVNDEKYIIDQFLGKTYDEKINNFVKWVNDWRVAQNLPKIYPPP